MVPLSANFKTDNEDVHVISRTSVSRIVNTVTTALLTLGPIYHNVKFPRDDKSINDNLLGFSCIFNFPNVIGAIDWIHIPMKAPKPKINSLYKHYEVCVASLKFANLRLLNGLVYLMMLSSEHILRYVIYFWIVTRGCLL